MNDIAADLDLVIAKTRHERFRELAADPLATGLHEWIRSEAAKLRGEGYSSPSKEIAIGRVPRDHRLRVGFLTPCLLKGGTEEWHRQLVLNLDPRKIALTGLVVTQPADVERDVYQEFASKVPTGIGPEAAKALIDTSEIIVTWGAADFSPFKLRSDLRVVGVGHGDSQSVWGRKVIAALAPHVTHWVAVSESAYTPETNRSVVPNGCDLSRVKAARSRADVRSELGFTDKDRVILHVGRLVNCDKHLDVLVESMALLDPRYKLLLVGDGNDWPEILALAETKIPGRFVRVPFTLAIGDYLHAADDGILLSHSEGFGLVLVEYLAAGLPTISTPVGFAKSHPECFRIVESAGNHQAVASTIIKDFDDPDRLTRTEAGTELVSREYSSEAFVMRWEDYFQSIAPPPPALPSRWEMAKSLVKSVAAQIAAGNPLCTDEETDARLAVCEVCPQRIPGDWRCGGVTGCGCWLREKAPLKTSQCPSGKWPL